MNTLTALPPLTSDTPSHPAPMTAAGGPRLCAGPGSQPAEVGQGSAQGTGQRVLVLGHRGAPGPQRPENTVRAVEAALDRGADGVEVDVRLTSDGVLLCSHAPVLTTPAGDRLVVAGRPSDEFRRAGLRASDRLASLAEVLAAVGRRGPCHLVVEAKPAADDVAAVRTARALQMALEGVSDSVAVTVSSFDWRLLGVVHAALAGSPVHTAVLGPVTAPVHLALRHALDAGHHEAHLSFAALRRAPHAVRLARHLGVAVTAWTVNGQQDLRSVAAWGVDAVITDNVVLAKAALGEVARTPPGRRDVTAC